VIVDEQIVVTLLINHDRSAYWPCSAKWSVARQRSDLGLAFKNLRYRLTNESAWRSNMSYTHI
jgi:hypothetical protein